MTRLLILFFCSVMLSCCGQKPLPPIPGNAKVYSIQEKKGGLVRLQMNELLPFAKAKNYLCAHPNHMNDIVNCVGGGVKIYSLQPARGGIYRKQANELKTYAEATGYLCTSPKDFAEIQDQCPTSTRVIP